jgi:hypothetical protein
LKQLDHARHRYEFLNSCRTLADRREILPCTKE